MLDIILLTIVIVWLIAATTSDIKTKEIPNWINFSLVIIAFSIFSIKSMNQGNADPILKSIKYFLIFLVIGNLMYYTKQWGGGDSKLLIALGAAIPVYPEFLLNFFTPNLTNSLPLTFLINLVIVGSLYGLIYTLILVFKNTKKVSKKFRKILNSHKNLNKFLIASALIGTLFFISSTNLLIKTISLLVLVSPVILSYIFILTKATEQVAMYKEINSADLQEGDWIKDKIIINKKTIYSPRGMGVTKEQINIIKKHKKKVTIKDGIAFAPPFLIAVILSLIYGNVIFLII